MDGRPPPPIRTVDVITHASPQHKDAATRILRAPGKAFGGPRADDVPRQRLSGEQLADRVLDDSLDAGVVVHVKLHKLVELLNNRRCHVQGCAGHMQISSKPRMVGLVWSTATRCTACRAESPFLALSDRVVVVPRDPSRADANRTRRVKRQQRLCRLGKLPLGHVPGDHLRTAPAAPATYRADNVALQAALTLNGIGISRALRVMALMGWACPSRSAAEQIHRLVLRDGHELALAAMRERVLAAVAAGRDIELACDGAWSTRREANQLGLIVLWDRLPGAVVVIDRTIIGFENTSDGSQHVIRRKGNYDHTESSSYMEVTAWQRLTKQLDDIHPGFRPLVKAVCVDRDGRNNKLIKVCAHPRVPRLVIAPRSLTCPPPCLAE